MQRWSREYGSFIRFQSGTIRSSSQIRIGLKFHPCCPNTLVSCFDRATRQSAFIHYYELNFYIGVRHYLRSVQATAERLFGLELAQTWKPETPRCATDMSLSLSLSLSTCLKSSGESSAGRTCWTAFRATSATVRPRTTCVKSELLAPTKGRTSSFWGDA